MAESYDPPRLLLGETYVASPARMARFYGEGDELQLAASTEPVAGESLSRQCIVKLGDIFCSGGEKNLPQSFPAFNTSFTLVRLLD